MLTIQRINELVSGIDNYLKKIEGFSNSLREVKATLDELRNSQEKTYLWELEKLRSEISMIRHELVKHGLPEISQYEMSLKVMKESLLSHEWPRAVDPKSICLTEDMAFHRAQAILDLVIGESLTGKSFLDFGCGGGHVIMNSIKQNPKIAIGYDINQSKIKFDNDHFTSEFDIVAQNGPYDIILLQDVLDHLESEDAITILIKLKSILDKNGRMYIRNHPWCSRHGSHIYTQINKAYAHIVLDDSELCRIGGYSNDHTNHLYEPIEAYRNWFSESGFNVCSEIPITKNPEEFFNKQSFIRERMLAKWDGDEAKMKNNIQIEFVEYVVEPMENNNKCMI